MKVSKTIYILIVLINFSFQSDSSPIELLIRNKKDSLIKQITECSNICRNLQKLEIKSIEAYPCFEIDYDNLNTNDQTETIKLNEDANYFVINTKDKQVYCENVWLDKDKISIGPKILYESDYIKSIKKANKISDYVFLIKISSYTAIGYIVKGDIEFMDTNGKAFHNIKDVIVAYYGSIEHLIKQKERESFEINFLNINLSKENAKEIMRNFHMNYLNYFYYNPNLHAKALISQIENFATITAYQKQLLYTKLSSAFEKNKFSTKEYFKSIDSNYSTLYLYYDSCIMKILLETLTFKQYWDYKSNEQLALKLNNKAQTYLENINGNNKAITIADIFEY